MTAEPRVLEDGRTVPSDAAAARDPTLIAAEPHGDRLVITGYELLESRLLVARVDRATGALRLDTEFKPRGAAQPGVDFSREQWPHGATGRAIPHGAVFSRPH